MAHQAGNATSYTRAKNVKMVSGQFAIASVRAKKPPAFIRDVRANAIIIHVERPMVEQISNFTQTRITIAD